jgi:hypothetical protein
VPDWVRRFLRLHSPSRHYLGTCWCQDPNREQLRKIAQSHIDNSVRLQNQLRVARSVLAEREYELLALKGPCCWVACSLHYAHAGPCNNNPKKPHAQRPYNSKVWDLIQDLKAEVKLAATEATGESSAHA